MGTRNEFRVAEPLTLQLYIIEMVPLVGHRRRGEALRNVDTERVKLDSAVQFQGVQFRMHVGQRNRGSEFSPRYATSVKTKRNTAICC
jgi:hypothetical protein